MKLLVEAARGQMRHCPTCGANAYGPPYSDFGDPRQDWKDAYLKANPTPERDMTTPSRDWSQPRPIPWLPVTHPNYYVSSQREAIRVCKDWGLDPERNGFISEKHRARAVAAAAQNRGAYYAALSPREQARVQAARRRSAGKN